MAGNPLIVEQQSLPNDAHRHVTPPPRVQSPSTPQSLEEQLQELQKQQHMQLQALQNLQVSETGLDLRSVQNVIPPNLLLPVHAQPGTGQLPQGVPQLIPTLPNPDAVQSPPQSVLPPSGMPSQQLPGIPNQQLLGMLNQQPFGHVTIPATQPSSQADLLGLDTSEQHLLQAPLEPTDSMVQEQDTIRAIQDLQLLLTPPGDGTDNINPMPAPQMAPLQPLLPSEQTHESTEGSREVDTNSSVEQLPNSGPTGSIENMPPQSEENIPPKPEENLPPSGSEEESVTETGRALPDVLQVIRMCIKWMCVCVFIMMCSDLDYESGQFRHNYATRGFFCPFL